MKNTDMSFKRNSLGCLIALAIVTLQPAAVAQSKIAGISVQSYQEVISPATKGSPSINRYLPDNDCPAAKPNCKKSVLASLSDEHSTIFPPGTLPGHANDYLFFTPPGVVVLMSLGPDKNGVWTLDFAPDYDTITPESTNPPIVGQQIFGPPLKGQCPTDLQDTTFDLNYAGTGSVILDPTREPSTQLLAIYEGTNLCFNKPAGVDKSSGAKGFYATLGVATSEQFGKLWPAYSNTLGSTTLGPNVPAPVAPPIASFGSQVCVGMNYDACTPPIPSTYGRYPIVSPHYSMQQVIGGKPLSTPLGEQAPSAFVDEVHPGLETYVYVVHNHDCKECTPAEHGLTVSRARLQGYAPLQFENWSNGAFRPLGSPQASPGIGGSPSPIFPASTTASQATHASCLDPTGQAQIMGSISYVPQTNQYLLIFLCRSQTDFANPPNSAPSGDPTQLGAAWFYSTLDASLYDLSRQDQWSTPAEISGSWHWLELSGSKDPSYCIYDGWYPSFMSLGAASGYLSTSGYAFSMDGCPDGSAGRPRRYLSRAFTMTVTTLCSNPIVCCIQAGGTWSGGHCQ